jgi:hypothetical protein
VVWSTSFWWRSKELCPNDTCGHFGRGLRPSSADDPWRCRACRQPLPRPVSLFRTRRPVVVILMGTAGSGKSSWLICGLQKLETRRPLTFPIHGQEESWRGCKTAMARGFYPPPTPAVPSVAWCVDLEGRSWQRLQVYDISGLEAADSTMLARHRSFRHVTCLVLAVDPFSLVAVRSQHGEALRWIRPPVRPASRAFGQEHLGALLSTLENVRASPRDRPWDVAVAVILTKLNVLGLVRMIGEPNATLERVNEACRQQLASWDAGSLVRALDVRFHRVHYFAPTPTGEGVFSPDQPLLWAADMAKG